jgi:hypothetical protein
MTKDFYDFDELVDDELDKEIDLNDDEPEVEDIEKEPKVTTRDDVPSYLKEVVSR